MAEPAATQAPPETPAVPSVPIELGPDLARYPDTVRAVAEPPKTEATAPASSEPGDAPPPPADAGASPDTKEEPEKGTRRQRGEDAYQRGIREGREQAEKDRTAQQAQADREQAAETERNRIRQLYRDLKSPDFDTREKASAALGDLADSTEQIGAIKQATRNETLAEIAATFTSIKDLDGVGDDGYQALFKAASPTELVKIALELGSKSAKTAADERIAELEAQLEAERGKRVGSSLTPERKTGSNGTGSRLTLEQYQRMSPREMKAAGITSADIDAMTAELMAEAGRNGR